MKNFVISLVMLFSLQVFATAQSNWSFQKDDSSVPPRSKMEKRIKKQNKKKKKKGDTTCPKIDC